MKGQRVDFDLVGSGDVKWSDTEGSGTLNNETFHWSTL